MSNMLFMFICWSQMSNFTFYVAHIYRRGGTRLLPWLHLEKWAFLYCEHNLELSIVNFDYLGRLEGTGQARLLSSKHGSS